MNGVIDVTGYGGEIKQYQVQLDTRLLRKYKVTLQQVEDAISKSNANVGGDMLTLGSQAHNVRAIALIGGGVDPLDPGKISEAVSIEADKIDELGNVQIALNAGVPVFLSQIANVVVDHKPRLGKVGRTLKEIDDQPILNDKGENILVDEDDVIEGIVLMRKYEKSLPTANAVADKMEQIQKSGLLPKGMTLRVFNQRTNLVHVTDS